VASRSAQHRCEHGDAMMNLIGLYESGQADAYWKSRRAA